MFYHHDFIAWCEDTAPKLKSRELDDLDSIDLIEKIESLGKSERRELKNRLIAFLAHILKLMYINALKKSNI
ncbi:DUF29 family protein [Trichodesmium erythraeum]|uniref:DUF29 family protein n=1 Tax=Trichodesmium erythraeum TaxID=1206 RepID=UPI0012DCE5EF|nr:DUF29 family protein [Trichodesmium erythraeum GBRTRLIN201]